MIDNNYVKVQKVTDSKNNTLIEGEKVLVPHFSQLKEGRAYYLLYNGTENHYGAYVDTGDESIFKYSKDIVKV